jgi:hypothetical protein
VSSRSGAADEVLRPSGQGEGIGQGSRRFNGGLDSLDRQLAGKDRLVRPVRCVLDRGAGQTDLAGEAHRLCHRLGRLPESVFQIRGHRQGWRVDDGAHVFERLIPADRGVAVTSAQRKRQSGTGSGQPLEPEVGE